MRPVGYYVHHQGAGHRQRAILVARALRRPCTLIGTFEDGHRPDVPGPVLDLPDDRLGDSFEGIDGEGERPRSLHYAPLGHRGVRDRMAMIAAWIAREEPAVMVVDVSVEVTLLARLLSVPILVWRLAGDRVDLPHLEAFRAAEGLLAPFPAALDHPATPDWVRRKTLYLGFVGSRSIEGAAPTDDGGIVVLCGRGGGSPAVADLAGAARAVPDRMWHVLGAVQAEAGAVDLPANLHLHGWVEDVQARLAPATLVVGSGGDGVVAAVARAGKRFVCVPEPRPYGEQASKAEGIARLGAAVTLQSWPDAAHWPAIVREALALDPRILAAWADPQAAARIAAAIEAVAAKAERPEG